MLVFLGRFIQYKRLIRHIAKRKGNIKVAKTICRMKNKEYRAWSIDKAEYFKKTDLMNKCLESKRDNILYYYEFVEED